MKWTVEYIEAQNYILVTTEGSFTSENNQKMTEAVLSSSFWKPGSAVLFDHRKTDFDNMTLSNMREAAGNHRINDARIGDGKTAILMRSMLDFARGRQFEILTEHEISAKIRIFLDQNQALIWLLA